MLWLCAEGCSTFEAMAVLLLSVANVCELPEAEAIRRLISKDLQRPRDNQLGRPS